MRRTLAGRGLIAIALVLPVCLTLSAWVPLDWNADAAPVASKEPGTKKRPKSKTAKPRATTKEVAPKDASPTQVETPSEVPLPAPEAPHAEGSASPRSLKFAPSPANVLRGPDARRQLVLDGMYADQPIRDVTHLAQFEVHPAGIVQVNADGLVLPLADGKATIVAKGPAGLTDELEIQVERVSQPDEVNFPGQIVPIFTKFGCNAGGCHGKSSGQNGFKLSLLGFYPDEDYEFLVKEARGRRVFPAAPEQSLLLLKATNSMAHGGGHRIDAEGYEYQQLVRWMEQGMPYGKQDAPTITRIEVLPAERSMGRGGQQQLEVLAWSSDGSVQDVTRIAQFEPNDSEMAEVSNQGLVKTLDLAGDVAIMVRFQGQVGVFRASIPLGLPVENLPPSQGFVDDLVFGKLRTLGIPPSGLCDDATFVRRASLDICGRLPTAEEARAFVADADPAKRDKLIDRLLASGDYADFFANKWSLVLRNRSLNGNYTNGTYAFREWLRESFRTNMPYDQFVREIVGASGEIDENAPVAWYRFLATPESLLEDTAQLFLGLRIQCARCHHHPYERWSQRDYYAFSAFFSRVGRKQGINGLQVMEEPRIFHDRGLATATNPRSGEAVKPAGLGAEPIEVPADEDPRQALADWMSQPDNPFFSKALVNRYWKHFLGRGIVDPEDDMRVTNPASNPELLDRLARHFVESGFDLKDLIRTLCRSSVYQLSSEPNEFNANDKQNFSFFRPKRMQAEVLYDALNQVTANVAGFNGLPAKLRAIQLPDSSVSNYFLSVFGRPEAISACECERSGDANLAQSLHLLNSGEIQQKLSSGTGRAALLAQDQETTHERKVREIYAWAYAREPDQDELKLTLTHLAQTPNQQQAFEDILWAIVNTKEFQFNH